MHSYLQPPASPLASVSTNTGLLLAPANIQNFRSSNVIQQREVTKYLVVVHPEPMHGTVHTEYEQLFREMHALIPQKIGSFILQARNLGLMFQIEGNFQKDDTTASLILSGSSSPSSSTGRLTPTSQFPWSFMMTGKGQCSAHGAKLLPSRSSPEHVMHRDLQKNGSRLPVPSAPYHEHQLVFILPLWDIIAGPVNGHGMHCCLVPQSSMKTLRRSTALLCVSLTPRSLFDFIGLLSIGLLSINLLSIDLLFISLLIISVCDITAPSTMLAAQGFLAVCKTFCQVGTSDEPILPEDVEITDCMALNMVIGLITANIGHGVGNGPMHTFWGTLITLITQYSGHWQLISDTGLIICTGFILEMELLPILPHVLVYLLDTYQTSIAQPFLDVVSPVTSQHLCSWPPLITVNLSTGHRELNVTFACDPYTMILEIDGTVQISQLCQLSEAVQESLGQQLYFHINGPGSTQSIIQGMFAGHTLTSPEQVINLISYQPIEQCSIHLCMGYIPDLDYTTLAEQFMEHLKCYLCGHGAPYALDGSALFEEPSHSNDTLLRSHLFL
ncbi:uncharacterized protein BJ212DRAFT_1294562 [Suillus subaureus]|uniref:Uncharacterized protein n=1 Tax=Suillus subaureus TaxID=48587 RepID=A0A9P7JKD4_9AGAM|nr:uncharacterized protein BJ212DRAFT_1294562 [Suillus subaureus]KAG1827232.1 hypothetical protein BJ212DRAFT_1294562 [Suillus subaureus]